MSLPKQQTITGVIVRRSCMGKNLSFADIRCENEDDRVVKISFRRQEPCWNEAQSPTPFPTKASKLPYGGLVEVSLQENNTQKKNGVWNVMTWTLKEDPKQTAEAIATLGEQEGLSYSKYLKERGEQFSNLTTKGQILSSQSTAPKQHPKKRLKLMETENGNKATANTTDESIHSKSNNSTNDDLAQDGGHGDKTAKTMRARIFAQWLIDTFGSDYLSQGGGVLDVAGGKGQLSIQLAATGKIPCVVIDPLLRKKHCTGTIGTTSGFPAKRDAKRIRKAGGPLPRHLATFFNQTSFLERYGATQSGNVTTTRETKEEGFDDDEDQYLVDRCTALIGLHPDQTTEDILDMALKYNKSVAIVPCCVFPSFFPLRKLEDGTMVNNHAQFCQYLCAKDSSLKQAVLSFEGRNVVIYRKVERGKGRLKIKTEMIERGS